MAAPATSSADVLALGGALGVDRGTLARASACSCWLSCDRLKGEIRLGSMAGVLENEVGSWGAGFIDTTVDLRLARGAPGLAHQRLTQDLGAQVGGVPGAAATTATATFEFRCADRCKTTLAVFAPVAKGLWSPFDGG